MKLNRARNLPVLFSLSIMMLVAGCGSSSSVLVDAIDPVDSNSLESFSAELGAALNSGSTNCGIVRISMESSAVDTCVEDMFTASSPFYAVYELMGIDSTVAEGVSLDAQGKLLIWSFDSSITGQGDSGPVRIESEQCLQPTLLNSTEQTINGKFGCYIPVDQFEQQLMEAAGDQAVRCTTVEIDQSPQLTDVCVENAIAEGKAFTAIYMLRGIDSEVAEGVSGDSSRNVTYWSYDSSITGQGVSGPSRVSRRVCPVFMRNSDAVSNDGSLTDLLLLQRFTCS